MTTEKSRQITCGSDLPQEKLVKEYANALTTDRDPKHFDSRIRDLVRIYLKEGYNIDEIVAQTDSINYSSSKYEYAKIEEQICKFEESNHPYFGWNRNYQFAKEYLLNEVRDIHLSSLVYHGNNDIMNSLPKKDTHAGSDYLLSGKRKKGEYAEDIYTLVIKAEEEAKEVGTFNMPMMIGSRTQASMPFDDEGVFTGTFKSKTRLVSMKSIREICTELRWSKGVQEALASFRWFAGGKSDTNLKNLMNTWRHRHNQWISIDYSGFDQSISKWLIYDAFEIIESMFRRDKNHDSELFWIMVKDFCNKSFIDGEGKLRYSEKGVASGSMFTQIIDTLVNRLMILTYLKSKKYDLNDVEMCIMGDDNIIFSMALINTEDLEGYLNKNFGVRVNADKSSSGSKHDDPEFLSRYWSFSGAYRNWKHVLTKMFYPERFRVYGEGKSQPELILYSYMLAYPATFDKLIDSMRFSHDYPNLRNKLKEDGVAGLSGYLAYKINYLGVTD